MQRNIGARIASLGFIHNVDTQPSVFSVFMLLCCRPLVPRFARVVFRGSPRLRGAGSAFYPPNPMMSSIGAPSSQAPEDKLSIATLNCSSIPEMRLALSALTGAGRPQGWGFQGLGFGMAAGYSLVLQPPVRPVDQQARRCCRSGTSCDPCVLRTGFSAELQLL